MSWEHTKAAVERAILNTPIEGAVRRAWWMARCIARPRLRSVIRHDRLLEAALSRSLSTDSNCVDIGCNKGHVLAWMLRAAPQGRHVAFEPIPELAAFIRRRFPAVTVHDAALSDYTGESTFYRVVKNHGRSGLVRQDYPDNDKAAEITVPVRRLDDLITGPVDLIKIDVEGAELGVLRGARRVLGENRPVVIFEYISTMSARFGAAPEELHDELAQHGLAVYELADWLAGKAPLTRDAFCSHRGGNFLAHQ